MELSSDSWNSLTLPFKAMNLETQKLTHIYDLAWGSGKFPELETEDKDLIPSQPLTKCVSLGKLYSLSGTQIPTLVR